MYISQINIFFWKEGSISNTWLIFLNRGEKQCKDFTSSRSKEYWHFGNYKKQSTKVNNSVIKMPVQATAKCQTNFGVGNDITFTNPEVCGEEEDVFYL